ncbi:MAG: DUF2723 domain-containing protein [Chthoniobacteraceae bacterium]
MTKLFPTRQQRLDAIAALVTFGVSFAVYFYTAAPNITMQDAGEEAVAAEHFGVCHPPGYPLWTLLGWLFHLLLPFGNATWRLNIFSCACGAIAVGGAAWLLSNSIRWFFTPPGQADDDPKLANTAFVIAVSFSLAAAFSVSMWSQAVIVVVYPLLSLCASLYLITLYRWIKDPSRLSGLVLVIFTFSLGMSGHHLMLSLAVLPLMAVMLLRRDFLAEFLVFMALAAGVIYLGFAKLSGELATWNTAVRFLWCGFAGLIVLVWIKRGLLRWRVGLCLLVVSPLGLLPYAYMPIASSTNPPMNWGYTREPAGFFYAINRSQYQGPLSSQLLRTLGKALGSAMPDQAWEQQQQNTNPTQPVKSPLKGIMTFAGEYWVQLFLNFSAIPVIGFVMAITIIFGRERNRRAWVFLLFIAFFLAAFLQPFFDQPGIDLASWNLQMRYHGYTYLIFSVLSAMGFAFLFLGIQRKFKLSHLWIYPLLALPIYGLVHNRADSSQRNHWFGWKFGHDMLKDLPKSSVLFGGTDPGRFIPTYMIFGESPQPPSVKRDPDFDRRDLYIITQNTLADPFYLKYLRDQYTTLRPKEYGQFGKWLGRDTAYPKDTIIMPGDEDLHGIVKKLVDAQQQKSQGPIPPTDIGTQMNSAVSQWIFEHNRDQHTFFIEESFPLEWSYPYAIPSGLIYRLNHDPLDKIPGEDIAKDTQFWKKYTADLLDDPHYLEDFDAKRSFSKLRTTTGNIYRYRNLKAEAEAAYRQALQLWPANTEAIAALLRMLADQKRFDDAIALMTASYPLDPYNPSMQQMIGLAFLRKQLQGDIETTENELHSDPKNRDFTQRLLHDYEEIDDKEAADQLIVSAQKEVPDDTVLLQDFINHYVVATRFDKALELARKWDQLEPDNPEVKFMLTKFFFITGARSEFYSGATKAVEMGGISMRERYAHDPVFAPVRPEPEFQALIKAGSAPVKSGQPTPDIPLPQ